MKQILKIWGFLVTHTRQQWLKLAFAINSAVLCFFGIFQNLGVKSF